MQEAKEEATKARVEVTETEVTIGEKKFKRAMLQGWGAWHGVEAALKKLPTAPTEAEWDALASAATTSGAKRGLAEVKSALATFAHNG